MLSNKYFYIAIAMMAILSTSCQSKKEKDSSILWGKTNTYNDFLWKKHVPDTLKQTLCFEFNNDAQTYMDKPLKLGVFKKDANNHMVQVQEDEMELFANGQKVDGNTISVPSNCKELEIGVVFNDNAEDKVHYWYVKPVDNGGLERINDKEMESMASEDAIMEIRAKKNHVMNPLAEGLLFLAIFIVALLVVWLLILKPIIFPVFKVKKLELVGPEPYINAIQIKRYRKLVLTSKNMRQGGLSQLFTGKIKYSINALWTADVEFVPKDKRSIRIRPDKAEYMADTRILKTNNDYTLENIKTRTKTIMRLS